MDLTTDYKQTEVGVIPADWEVRPFQSLAHIERGKFTARPRNDPRYYGGEIPFIQTGDVKNSSGEIRTYSQTLNQEGLNVSKLFPPGTLFFTIAANIADVGFAAFATACPDSLIAITPSKGVDKRWLAQELRKCKPAFENAATHNAQLNINLDKLRPFLLPVPPPAEQEAIAEALGDADALIESLEQLLAKKRHIKQGAMQELLTGKKRLPGFSGEWAVKRLGELGSTFGGLTGKSKRDFGHGSARYVTFMNIMTNVVIDCGTFELVEVNPTESQNRVVRGDLFFNGSSETPEEVGMCAVLSQDVKGVFLNSFCFGFRFHQGTLADGLYLAYYFRSREGRELLKSLAQGATRYNLSKIALLKIPFRLPVLPEQTAIAAILSEMDEEIAAMEAKLAKSRLLKKGMMQELLTGRIRLV